MDLLPDFIEPRVAYPITFKLRVISELFECHMGVSQTCDKYGISVSMLYRWKEEYARNKERWTAAVNEALALERQLA